MDTGQKLTEEELKKLERRIAKEYKTAVKEMEQKLKDYLEETEAGRQVQLQLYRAGKISKDDYESWVYRHTMVGRRWEAMRDTLAADMHRTNEIAKAMSEGQAADVFALNGNYATYQLEHDGKIDTGFTLYNHDTAQYLLEDQRQLMPVPSDKKAREIAANKDMKWNMKKIQSAVLQGVMQGESPYAVAERLEQVGQMNHNSAVRYARTMTTSAQNAGRYEAYRRADKLGVNLSIEWQATLDSRTRNDHRLMHGQRRKVDEPFILPDGQKILFPADCTHNSYELQGEIWNCRCTLLSWVKGFEGDTVKDSPKMDGMSFEEWQHAKEPKAPKAETAKQERPKMTAEERQKVLDESFVIRALDRYKIKPVEVSRYDVIPAENEIIEKLCGGDETEGSCASLSMAYAANKLGFDVTDFRGGRSQEFFSSMCNSIIGKHGIVDAGYKEIDVAVSMLKKIEPTKEYILSTGKHAAIVRNHNGVAQYLELQEEDWGWYTLDERALLQRFGCRKSVRRTAYGKTLCNAYLTDIRNLEGDPVFEEVLPYINTNPAKQKKGKYGYAK